MLTLDTNSQRFTGLQVYMLNIYLSMGKVSIIGYMILAGTMGLQVYRFTLLLRL